MAIKCTKEVSQALYVSRCIAILSVAAAHCSYSSETLQKVSSILGLIGVPIFFVQSGLLSERNGVEWPVFIKKKWNRIIVPWIVWSVLTFSIACVLHSRALTITEYVKWAFGYLTWLYYPPVLIAVSIICRCLEKKVMPYLIIISAICNMLYIVKAIPMNGVLTSYQNPLNWIGFYAAGILLSERVLDSTPSKNQFRTVIWVSLTVFIGIIMMIGDGVVNYWHPLAIAFECCAMMAVYQISIYCAKSTLLQSIGKRTYFLYFTHIQLGIAAARRIMFLLHLSGYGISIVIQPVIVIAVVFILGRIIETLLSVTKCDCYSWIIGL